MTFHYIADGKLFLHTDTGDRELVSGVYTDYVRKVRDSASRNEWKTQGAGAMFTGSFQPGQDANTAVSAIRARITSAAEYNGSTVYAIDIDGVSGIYQLSETGGGDGIVQSNATQNYGDFDILGEKMTYSSAFGGQSHIGSRTMMRNDSCIHTDGESWDFQPVFDRTNPNRIYFCSSGLKIDTNAPENSAGRPATMLDFYRAMTEAPASDVRGPSALCLLDTAAGTLDTVLESNSQDYLHPQSMPDGSLWYIRRPYKPETGSGANPFGCLLDILLLPVRLLKALFGFFSLFSMKYSGEPLAGNDVKNKSEKQMFIDGNLIDAEKAMKENAKRGEETPGIIPKTWELHRLSPDGNDVLIRKGVTAFRVLDDGAVLFFNGSCVLLRTETNGKVTEKKVSPAQRVTFIH